MAASPSPYTSQRVEYVPSEQEKMRFELGYGAKNAPGRIALREASRIGSILEGYNKGTPGAAEKFFGYSPTLQDYKNIVTNQPNYLRKFEQYEPKEAAKGGLMALRGYADGGSAEKVVPDYIKEAVAAQEAKNKYPVAGTGTYTPPTTPQWIQDAVNADAAKKAAAASTPKGPAYSIADALTGYTAGYDPTQKEFAGMTNPYAQQALTEITNLQTPAEYKAATDLYGQLASGLQGMANYTPQQATAGRATAAQGTAAQMGNVADVTAPTLADVQMNRGDIRDIAPIAAEAFGYDPTLAEASNYDAAAMQAPEGIAALGYDAAQMQAAQMNRADVRDVNAQLADVERYNASLMGAPADIASQSYEAAQAAAAQANRGDIRDVTASTATASTYNAALMGAPQGIAALDYEAAQAQGSQMKGPSSWTEAGTAEKYMNPYIQNVVDIEKREANRDYQRQLNELNKQAVGAKAYGGSRLAIERSEAARNQAMKLADIEAKGLNEAYQQGMGQFATEQGQTLQAGQANLSAAQQTALANQQALNSQRQTFVTQALEAARNNYGGQLTAEQQNQVAQNATAQFNAQNQTQISQINAQLGITAQQANQQADIGLTQLNTQNQQQTAIANQASTNAQRSQYIAQALQAAQTNYGGQLTAAQQNQIAQNAAAQFNAQSQNTVYNNYVAQQLAAQQGNQQMDFGVGQLNTQMEQQANAANQAAINAQRSQYVTQALQAAQNNYGGQLTAAQQNQIAQNAEAQFNAQANMATSQYNAGAANTAGQVYATALNQNSQFNAAQDFVAQQMMMGIDMQTATKNADLKYGTSLAQGQLTMQGLLANQAKDLTVGQANMNATNAMTMNNINNATNASVANAGYATDVSKTNVMAGLTANHQGIGALTAAMGAGSGMLQSGVAQTDFATNKIDLLGKAATTTNQLEQNYLDQQQKNAQNTTFGTNQVVNPAMNMLQGTAAATGSTNTNTAVR